MTEQAIWTTFEVMSDGLQARRSPDPYELRKRVAFGLIEQAAAQTCLEEAPESFEIVCQASSDLKTLHDLNDAGEVFSIGDDLLSATGLCQVRKS